ncbi:class I SAM-dependent RNA methyltransferase [Chitinimonas sp. BJYL2]|uniref:THUMP domain-containing class I SAM-dependent RNA methyltransferase n=1 Tax=Chitinimonas sp. BJYL2 TaxID=2976696 RepID=UPI0022B5AA54|nr:THUMP domain-containing protein [Chitinimonas sp. BJYL2]
MKQQFNYFAPCPRGLESILATELATLGAERLQATDGGVAFQGAWSMVYKSNLHSRYASRILWRLAERNYRGEDDLYVLAKSIDWHQLFDVSRTIKVVVTSTGSKLRSLDFAGLRIKDAVCDVFRQRVGSRPSVDTSHPDIRIHLFLTEQTATIYMDTSGEALFKRGYRQDAGEAPLRENLAAGILALSGWQPGETLLDPMCGSGTFLIEAAMQARNIAPGLRRMFAFEKLTMVDMDEWRKIWEAADAAILPSGSVHLYGSDIDRGVLDVAQANLEAAGLADDVSLAQANILDCMPPAPTGVMVCNPPYGIRLDEQERLAAFYPELGHTLKQHFSGWRAYFITADLRLAKLIRLSASKRTPLFNGALDCRLFEYRMVAGSNRRNDAAA